MYPRRCVYTQSDGVVIPALVIAALVMATASSGAMFKPGTWYESLNRPRWTPPNWVFPLVWTVLYVMIGYAGWLAWKAGLKAALVAWTGQLVCNALWSYLFFGRREMRWAMVDVLLLQAFVLAFIGLSWRPLPLAALLFLPYAVWVTLAATLNWRMIRLNPAAAGG